MATRFFSGSRDHGANGGVSDAVRLKKLEILKGGKLPITAGDRYKRILKKRLEEHQNATRMANGGRPMSVKAQQAMKEIAMKKAAKEEKALRQMIVIKPRSLQGAGRIDAKGRVYDLQDNLVLRVDAKNAKVRSPGGMVLGKYKPKSFMSNMLMVDWLKKYSPYFIKQRQLEIQKQMLEARMAQAAIASGGIYGSAGNLVAVDLNGNVYVTQPSTHNLDMYGNDLNDPHHLQQQQQQYQQADATHAVGGATVNAWGVASNNVWGPYGDNVWGGMADNVWGGSNSNIWGGIGGNPYGGRGMKVWGSGKVGQKNYFRPIWTFFTTLLGFKGGKHKERHAKVSAYRASHGGGRHGGGASGTAAARTGGRGR